MKINIMPVNDCGGRLLSSTKLWQSGFLGENFAYKNQNMISENECEKILNKGASRFSTSEIKLIKGLLISLASIEYENYKSDGGNHL